MAAVLSLFLAYVVSLRPSEYFGQFHDDTIYFSSAKALAEGRGYVLPSLPGPGGTPPAQTKYPVLYPWILSVVWQLFPSFPVNLNAAVAVSALFSCWFLAAAFVMLRRLEGVGEWPALAIAAVCAFHPLFVFLSGVVLSDTLFIALALTAAICGDRAMHPDAKLAWLWMAALLAGLSCATRPVGLAVLLGIAAAGVGRRLYRRAMAFCLAVAPFLTALAAWNWIHSRSAAAAAAGEPGWIQTWAYYTSYGQFWRLSVPNWAVFRTLLEVNLQDLLQTPSTLCLFPPLTGYAGVLLSIVLTVGLIVGIVRQARRQEWQPIHFAAVFTAGIILLWNYAISDRYLMLFLPLFYAGLWIEGRHLVMMARAAFVNRRPVADRLVAVVLCVALVALAAPAIESYAGGLRPQLRRLGPQRSAALTEKREAYDWIRRNTMPETRFVAYEDAMLYLYTGRQAMWPMAFTNGAFYSSDSTVMQREVDHLPDVARHIGARYWVYAEGDYYRERGSELILKKVADWRSALPVVFRSGRGKVQIYDLGCVVQPAQRECRAAVPVLFARGDRP